MYKPFPILEQTRKQKGNQTNENPKKEGRLQGGLNKTNNVKRKLPPASSIVKSKTKFFPQRLSDRCQTCQQNEQGGQFMLIIERNLGESVVLLNPDGSVLGEIMIQSALQQSDSIRVRLGFEVDRSIKILRKELIGKGMKESDNGKSRQ